MVKPLLMRKKGKGLRINWRLSTILETINKIVQSYILWYVKVNIFWKFIQCIVHWDKKMLKKFSSEIFQKMYSFFSPELQLITVLPFFRNSYTSWSKSFIPLKLCVGFSIVDSVSFFRQKAWTLWLLNIILPFKIKTIEKPHTLLLPNLWFLSCNKKFESSKFWVGHIFSIVTVE